MRAGADTAVVVMPPGFVATSGNPSFLHAESCPSHA